MTDHGTAASMVYPVDVVTAAAFTDGAARPASTSKVRADPMVTAATAPPPLGSDRQRDVARTQVAAVRVGPRRAELEGHRVALEQPGRVRAFVVVTSGSTTWTSR